jgi:hypothetical protein
MTISEMFEQQMDKIDYFKFIAVDYVYKRDNNKPLASDEAMLLGQLHAKYFNHRFAKPCSCNPKQTKIWITDLEKLSLNGYK